MLATVAERLTWYQENEGKALQIIHKELLDVENELVQAEDAYIQAKLDLKAREDEVQDAKDRVLLEEGVEGKNESQRAAALRRKLREDKGYLEAETVYRASLVREENTRARIEHLKRRHLRLRLRMQVSAVKVLFLGAGFMMTQDEAA